VSASAAPAFEVLRFEAVPGAAGVAVLALTGRFAQGRPARVRLLVERDRQARPQGVDAVEAGGDPWTATFAVPLDVLEGTETRYALEAGRGPLIALPAPTPAGAGDIGVDAHVRLARSANELRHRLAAAEDRAAALADESAALRARAEQAEGLSAEAARLAEQARVIAERARADADREVDEAKRRAAEVVERAQRVEADAGARVSAAERAASEARAEAADAARRLRELEVRAAEAEQDADRARAEADRARAEAASAHAAAEDARADVATARASADDAISGAGADPGEPARVEELERQLEAAREEAEAAWIELRSLRARVDSAERRAEAAEAAPDFVGEPADDDDADVEYDGPLPEPPGAPPAPLREESPSERTQPLAPEHLPAASDAPAPEQTTRMTDVPGPADATTRMRDVPREADQTTRMTDAPRPPRARSLWSQPLGEDDTEEGPVPTWSAPRSRAARPPADGDEVLAPAQVGARAIEPAETRNPLRLTPARVFVAAALLAIFVVLALLALGVLG